MVQTEATETKKHLLKMPTDAEYNDAGSCADKTYAYATAQKKVYDTIWSGCPEWKDGEAMDFTKCKAVALGAERPYDLTQLTKT